MNMDDLDYFSSDFDGMNVTSNNSRSNSNTESDAEDVENTSSATLRERNNSEMEVIRASVCDHLYLDGLDTEQRGRVMLDDYSIYRIPIVQLVCHSELVPEQILPLRIFDSWIAGILKDYFSRDQTIFSVLSTELWDHCIRGCETIGTTAQVIEYGHSSHHFQIKAIGRQRFRVIKMEDPGNPRFSLALVEILPEISLPNILSSYHLPSLNRIRSSQLMKYRCLNREAELSQWPLWTHLMYDEKSIVQDVKRRLASNLGIPSDIDYPDEGNALFFKVLRTVPVQIPLETMQEGMALNTSIQRLHWLQVHVLRPKSHLLESACGCAAIIGKSSDMVAVSADGPSGLYGYDDLYLSDIITLKDADNLIVSGTSYSHCSWFPNYAWDEVYCRTCHQHMGWKYVACKKYYNPHAFYGILRSALKMHDICDD